MSYWCKKCGETRTQGCFLGGCPGIPHEAVGDEYAQQQIIELMSQRDAAIRMLAEWCVSVHKNGTSWDDWDEHYKDAMYRPGPLRGLLDLQIAEVRAERD